MAGKQLTIKDPDLAKVGIALKRSALRARKLGLATNTPVYVFREGKIVDIVAEQRAAQRSKKVSSEGSAKQKPRLIRRTAKVKTRE